MPTPPGVIGNVVERLCTTCVSATLCAVPGDPERAQEEEDAAPGAAPSPRSATRRRRGGSARECAGSRSPARRAPRTRSRAGAPTAPETSRATSSTDGDAAGDPRMVQRPRTSRSRAVASARAGRGATPLLNAETIEAERDDEVEQGLDDERRGHGRVARALDPPLDERDLDDVADPGRDDRVHADAGHVGAQDGPPADPRRRDTRPRRMLRQATVRSSVLPKWRRERDRERRPAHRREVVVEDSSWRPRKS